jgi:outer membrane protein OmpU
MNNLKKIGLSALAGSLAAVSANAAELGVSGGFQLNYSANGGTHDTTGNNWGMDNSVVLTASGDVNGYTVSYLNTLAGLNSGLSSSEYTVDLGDLGTIGFDQGVGSYGIDTIDNKMPNAYEEAEAGVGQDGISLSGSSGVFGYKNTLGPVALNVEYVPANGATDQDATNAFTAGTTGRNVNFAAAIDTGVEGLALGFGMMSEDNHEAGTQTNDAKEQTAYVSYTYESVTLVTKFHKHKMVEQVKLV